MSGPGPVVRGVDHVTIAVHDLEASIRWYTQALGFELAERRDVRGALSSARTAVLRNRAAIVVVVEGADPRSHVRRFLDARGEGVTHVAYGVDDLDVALDAVRSAGGVEPLLVVEDEGIRQAFLHRDPATGVRIELIERAGGTFTDASVLALYDTLDRHELD